MSATTGSRTRMTSRRYNPSQRASWAEGQPISDLMSRALANPKLISLAAGFVDQDTLPVEPTRLAVEGMLSEPQRARAALQYGTTPGYLPLRARLLERFLERDCGGRVAKVTTDHVVVTAGSNQLLHLVAESIMDPGDIVLCAAPSYLVFLGTLSNIGARSVGVAVDQDGMIPEALEEQLDRIESEGELARVKAIYIVSDFDNPSGITTSEPRRAAIVEIAKRWSKAGHLHVIADEAYRELRYWGDDPAATRCFDDEGGTVITAGTFSKSFSPGIRVGWGVLPPHLVEPVCNQKGNIDFGSPNFSQHLMCKILELGLFESHVEQLQSHYSIKLQTMLDAADQHLSKLDGVTWTQPSGGLYVWLKLPEHIDTGPDGPLFDAAVEEGVLYVPGQYCYPREGSAQGHHTIRLSFGVQSPDNIRAGIAALTRAIASVLGQRDRHETVTNPGA